MEICAEAAPRSLGAERFAGDGPAGEASIAPHFSPVHLYRAERRGPAERNDCSRCGGRRGGIAPNMRAFVRSERRAQQSMLCLHRLREGSRKSRTLHQPHPRICWPSSAWSSRSVRASCRRSLVATCIEDASNELGTVARMTLQRAHAALVELEATSLRCDERIAMHSAATQPRQQAATQESAASDPVTARHWRGHGRTTCKQFKNVTGNSAPE